MELEEAAHRLCLYCNRVEMSQDGVFRQDWIRHCLCNIHAHEHCLVLKMQQLDSQYPYKRTPFQCSACHMAIRLREDKPYLATLVQVFHHRIYQKLAILTSWVLEVGVWDMFLISYSFHVINSLHGGDETTENMLYVWDPQYTFALSNGIGLGILFFNLVPWDYYLLAGLRKCSRLPVVGRMMPRQFNTPPPEQTPTSWDIFIGLAGKLPIPFLSLSVGRFFIPDSTSALSQMLLGAGILFFSSTALKMYYNQRVYVRKHSLTIENFNAE